MTTQELLFALRGYQSQGATIREVQEIINYIELHPKDKDSKPIKNIPIKSYTVNWILEDGSLKVINYTSLSGIITTLIP